MRMRQIEAFRAVMMTGGVTAAATMLNISQPSVSRLIADLEHSVGFPLFDRRGGRVHATSQAQSLYEAVRRSFAGLDLLEQAARRIRAHPIGTIRIAALPALAATIVPAVLTTFMRDHPDVNVTIEVLGQRAIEDRIFLGQADLGIGVAREPREGIRTKHLALADYVCALPADHELAALPSVPVAALDGLDFIGPMHETDALWNGIDAAIAEAGIHVSRRIEAQQSIATYALVEAGLGVAIVEPFSAALFTRIGLAVRPILPPVRFEFVFLEPDIGPTPEAVAELAARIGAETAAYLAALATPGA